MRLYAKTFPKYFADLDTKLTEFRQIESITIENSDTHETRVFSVSDIRKCRRDDAEHIKNTHALVPWDKHLPMFAIELGDEIITQPAQGLKIAETGVREGNDSKYEFYGQKRREEHAY